MDKHDFLNHRNNRDLETIKVVDNTDPMSSLLSVQINTTELCNRKCVFCPRVDPQVYPNRNLHITEDLVQKIANDLKDINFKGSISMSGFGEPYLHTDITRLFKITKDTLKDCTLTTNTNGDQLTPELIQQSFDSGLDYLYVNLYDGPEQIEYFEKMFKSLNITNYILREHWPSSDSTYNLILNNRGGTLKTSNINVFPLKKQCYFPFTKLVIDYNGDVLLCPQDWNREYNIGSLKDCHIRDLWMGDEMKDIRLKLSNKDRTESPCNKCDCEGTLSGEFSYNLLMGYYGN